MIVWMEVSKDKYELPILIANTGRELAKLSGANYENVVRSANRKPKKHSRFIKVEIEDDE